jgi:hypothetical protein
MTTARWLTVPTQRVCIADLIATQPGIYFHGLTSPSPVGGDRYPHVIDWQGRLYLEDGHHRTTRAALNGEHTIEARVLTISDEARDTLLEAHGNRAATG